jgi:hypothetical protein
MNDYDLSEMYPSDPAQAEANARAKREREVEEADLKWLMNTKLGRRIVWRLLERAGVFRLSFSSDALAMAFSEGRRNEGLHILARINELCPDLYATMTKELNDGREHQYLDDERGE